MTAFALLCAVGMAAIATADITGPAPLSWRWSEGSSISPVGDPVAIGNSVFVATGGRTYCLSRTDGNEVWRFPSQAPLDNDNFVDQPVVTEDLVFGRTANQKVIAIDRRTGKGVWQYQFQKTITGNFAATQGNLIVALSDQTLIALDGETGAEIWQTPLKVDDGIAGTVTAGPDNKVYFFTGMGDLTCLDVATQKVVWKKRFDVVEGGTRPVVVGGRIYANSGEYVVCLNAVDGSLVWQTPVGETLIVWPGVSPVAVVAIDRKGLAYVLNARNGHFLLRQPVDTGGPGNAPPASVGTLFASATVDGKLCLFDPFSGKVVWHYLIHPMTSEDRNKPVVIGVPAAGAPVSAGNSLLVLAGDASLLCFDATTGVDLTPPDIKLVFPNPGEAVSGQPPLTLFFTIDDESSGLDPDTVEFFVDGHLVPKSVDTGHYDRTKEGYYLLRVTTQGPVLPLGDGRHVFTVKASDYMGNRGSEDFILIVDNQLAPMVVPGEAAPAPAPVGGGESPMGPGPGQPGE